ncbi:pseudouridine synthase [Pisciglobus halotolerans]|uniref:Pseudouridine synthase n=1 Tax=Pisciglobus halotolerans TaxID=745365 RepID=A0A1I3CKL8_9LACT|nr:pseudouridine synthase [Pisciglobus halotolerans]SFH74998.1 ribosomal small subunit pseudouridine synthase A [Pisciglobus halotolerans]
MRLDKLLAHTGFGTRKEVKALLKKGIVTVNGETEKDGKRQVDEENDRIQVLGEQVQYQEFVYFMLNKPQGVISATTDDFHETVIDLLEPQDQLQEPFPVGRLDIDTEGLLLLTNDGALAHDLLSPKKHVDKLYEAEIIGLVTEEDQKAFQHGIQLDDGYLCKPANLTIIKTETEKKRSTVQVTIREGKFHQVKRMFEAVDKKVVYLKRTTMGPLKLDQHLKLGQYRPLTEEEIETLKKK